MARVPTAGSPPFQRRPEPGGQRRVPRPEPGRVVPDGVAVPGPYCRLRPRGHAPVRRALTFLNGVPRSRWLSAAGGASVAYIFRGASSHQGAMAPRRSGPAGLACWTARGGAPLGRGRVLRFPGGRRDPCAPTLCLCGRASQGSVLTGACQARRRSDQPCQQPQAPDQRRYRTTAFTAAFVCGSDASSPTVTGLKGGRAR